MADIGITKNWMVSPTREIDEMWIKVQIQERMSAMNRYRQDIEDLTKGRMLDLQARIKMLELEVKKLENQLLQSSSIEAEAQTENQNS